MDARIPPRRAVTAARVRAIDGDDTLDRPDRLVTEEPLEIRVHASGRGTEPLAVTMRTPGADFELAAGWCLTEGVIGGLDDIVSIEYCIEGEGFQHYNVVTVRVRTAVDLDAHRRAFTTNSSCGLCGARTLDQVMRVCPPVGPGPTVTRSVLVRLPDRLREAQPVFDATGGLHAAALFDESGGLVVLREDIGRHNALDKVVGNGLLADRLPFADRILLVSGRVSFEIVQKAAVAGIPVVCAVSAPSSLAVSAAERLGQTVVGFLRGDRFNVYSHPERLAVAA